jgi:signal transduction histidine kinase
LGDEEKAERYFLRSLELSRVLKSDYGIVSSYEGLASIFYQRGDFVNTKRYLGDAIALAIKGSFNEELKNLYLLQYETEQSLGNHKQALVAYRQYTKLKDSMSNVDIQKNISLLDQQYQAERKEKMLLQKDLQINTQKVLLQNKNAWVIISTGAAALMLLLAFAAWGYFRQRRKADQHENELKQFQLSYSAKEEERNRIAGELHDDIGATLSSIHIYSSVAEKSLKEHPEKTKIVLQQINNSTRQVMENMSDIVWAMKQDQAGEKSFSGRIKNYGYDLLTSRNIECQYFIAEQAEEKLQNLEARKNILLIVKEAMNNISKYSGAVMAEVKMELNAENMLISIGDNGKGFNPTESSGGNGLVNMKRRTQYLGGTFSIHSLPGSGTKIQISIPITNISDTKNEK